MRRNNYIIKIFFIALFVIFANGSAALAGEAKGFFSLYKVDDAFAVGLKGRIVNNLYGAGNIEYHHTNRDLELRAGTVCLLPKEILFFHFYGGIGMQFSRNEGYQYPYLVLGTNFLFLFSEVIHPLEKEAEPRCRWGFNFKL